MNRGQTIEPVYIIFDGPPGPESGRFVEVETGDGRGINVGDWREYPGQENSGLWRLGPFYSSDAIRVEREARRKAEAQAEKRRRERAEVLDVASEWLLKTGQAEARAEAAEAKLVEAERNALSPKEWETIREALADCGELDPRECKLLARAEKMLKGE